MKISNIISLENYSLNINKQYFISKYEDSLGRSKATKLYYICYSVYEYIIKFSILIDKETELNKINKLLNKIEHYENRLQKLWGFSPNKSFHIYWNFSKSCSCKYHRNGSSEVIRMYSGNCKVHKHLFKKKEDKNNSGKVKIATWKDF
jgi:hypothetical protein